MKLLSFSNWPMLSLFVNLLINCQPIWAQTCGDHFGIAIKGNSLSRQVNLNELEQGELREARADYIERLGRIIETGNQYLKYRSADTFEIDGTHYMVNSILGFGREGGVYAVTDKSNYEKYIVKEFIEKEDLKSNSAALKNLADAGYPIANYRKSITGNFLIFDYFEGVPIAVVLKAHNFVKNELISRIKLEFEILSRTHKGIDASDVILDINSGNLKMVDSTDDVKPN